jgi:hypothetical protein
VQEHQDKDLQAATAQEIIAVVLLAAVAVRAKLALLAILLVHQAHSHFMLVAVVTVVLPIHLGVQRQQRVKMFRVLIITPAVVLGYLQVQTIKSNQHAAVMAVVEIMVSTELLTQVAAVAQATMAVQVL